MKKVLIIVDMQNDFVTGSLGSKEAQAIVPNVVKKVEDYKNNGGLIFFTQDTHYCDYDYTQEGRKLPVPHCVINTPGHEIIDELASFDRVNITKSTFGHTYWKEFFSYLDEDFEIELCGVCTDICVVSNALILKAFFPEVEITVDASCCAGVTPEKHKAALEVMKSCQINVING